MIRFHFCQPRLIFVNFFMWFCLFISQALATAPDQKLTDTYKPKASGFLEMITPPKDVSLNGHLIDSLFQYTTLMNIIFFSLVCLGLFGFSFFYSKKRHPKPLYTHGEKRIHQVITIGIALSVFVFIDMSITHKSNRDFTQVFSLWPEGDEVVKVQVLAQQWMWNMRYPGPDGVFNTSDDVVLTNDLRIPKGQKVLIQMTSKDVIHSLYIPNTRQKIDAIPGKVTRMWFQVNDSGIYEIACAEMCGTHHYKMRAVMTVYDEADYQVWKNESEKIAQQENDIENQDWFWGWKWDQELLSSN
jgi:cytochrome c oxidase subunit 2